MCTLVRTILTESSAEAVIAVTCVVTRWRVDAIAVLTVMGGLVSAFIDICRQKTILEPNASVKSIIFLFGPRFAGCTIQF